jgi:RNA polymerase sigma factor (sigma-70 family)
MTRTNSAIDAATLAAARDGCRAAHAELYERYSVPVYTVALRILASTSLAEDVLQDTFVEVIRKLDQFREQSTFEAWVKRIAVNKCLSMLRSSWWSRRSALDEEPFGPGLEQAASVDLELERLLAQLTPTARAVVWLHDGEGYTHGEIGELMGRSVSFSKSQLKRAHDRLRAGLEESESVETLCTSTVKTI